MFRLFPDQNALRSARIRATGIQIRIARDYADHPQRVVPQAMAGDQ
jgi:hypothetical protein